MIADVVEGLRKSFNDGVTRSIQWRLTQLRRLESLITENESKLSAALFADLRKCKMEAYVTEVMVALGDVRDAINNLSEWMAPKVVPTPAILMPAHSEIHHDPYGVVLIIGPFNYPVQLILCPLVGAIAGGNCAVIKPSEMCSETSTLFAQLIPRYLDERCVSVVEGAVKETQALLSERFDLIFFTGSERVGKIVMTAAANHLTPVILELGGKSPVIFDESVEDVKLAARRLIWGKLTNSGQTCIAPDYVLCHASKFDALVSECKTAIDDFYGEDVQKSLDLARIVNSTHVDRLSKLLTDHDGEVVVGGVTDSSDCYISPTIITNPSLTSKLMNEEIFGPILPIVRINDVQEAIGIINSKPRPLALYIFSEIQDRVNSIINSTTSGGVTVNDTLLHFANIHMPFGGVGPSGMGNYHGIFSFRAFSHERAILIKDTHRWLDVPIRYPPYTDRALSIFKFAGDRPLDIPPMSMPGVVFRLVVLLFVAIVVYGFISGRIIVTKP